MQKEILDVSAKNRTRYELDEIGVSCRLFDCITQHFNTANPSISDIKVWAISPISGGNDSSKRQEKRLIFKI